MPLTQEYTPAAKFFSRRTFTIPTPHIHILHRDISAYRDSRDSTIAFARALAFIPTVTIQGRGKLEKSYEAVSRIAVLFHFTDDDASSLLLIDVHKERIN